MYLKSLSQHTQPYDEGTIIPSLQEADSAKLDSQGPRAGTGGPGSNPNMNMVPKSSVTKEVLLDCNNCYAGK